MSLTSQNLLHTCWIWISLNDGRCWTGEEPAEDHRGVLFSPSDEGRALGGTTAIGLEGGPGINELNLTYPAPTSSTWSSSLSFVLVPLTSFILLCSFWMSRRDTGPFVIFAPCHAGPSFLGVGGGAGLGVGVSSRAPLRNNDNPPFLLFFFLVGIEWEALFFWELELPLGLWERGEQSSMILLAMLSLVSTSFCYNIRLPI